MLKREPYIDLVIGPQSYHKINDTILSYIQKKKKMEETEFDAISKFKYFSNIKNEAGIGGAGGGGGGVGRRERGGGV